MEKLIPKVGLRPRKICCWCLYNNDVLVNNGYCTKKCCYVTDEFYKETCEYYTSFNKE